MGENLVLAGVNAQYVHTALAVRQLAAVLRAAARPCDVAEYTINQHAADVLRDLALRRADAYLFSCYIWNVGLVRQVAADLRRVCPDALLVAGGPQAAHCAEAFLRDNPAFNAVATCEGESNIVLLADAAAGRIALADCPGLVYRDGDTFVATPDAPLPGMDGLPFAYDDLDALEGRILYYESMRGCPYRCSYCLSGRDGAVRAKSLEKVYAELDRFLAANVRQVKFVDRTFNCDAARALAIWQYLAAHDNGVTGFHFEMAGHLLTGEALDFLSTLREGLFQFEIGVQSTNPDTLAAIHRKEGLWRRQGHHRAPLSKLGQYQLLGDFAEAPSEELQALCRLDMALHEKPRVLPAWVKADGSRPHRGRVLAFYQAPGNVDAYLPNHRQYEPKQLLKTAHVEVLPFDPATGRPGECALLFDYTRRDVTGKALCRRITLPK